MKLKILVVAGDGIGPEVTNEAVAVLKETAALGGHVDKGNRPLIEAGMLIHEEIQTRSFNAAEC